MNTLLDALMNQIRTTESEVRYFLIKNSPGLILICKRKGGVGNMLKVRGRTGFRGTKALFKNRINN